MGRFDANSYLYITRAMDYFDLNAGFASLEEALRQASAEFLVVSVDADWLYPTAQAREIADALAAGGRPAQFVEICSPHGHDAFLIEHQTQSGHRAAFLASAGEVRAHDHAVSYRKG